MYALIMIVSILGPGSGETGNPGAAVALNVTEIGRFAGEGGQKKCMEAGKNASISQRAVPGPSEKGANVGYQFVCIEAPARR